MDRARVLQVLQMISEDAETDARALDGQPFDARAVAKNFGQIYAAIQALANIVKADMEERADV